VRGIAACAAWPGLCRPSPKSSAVIRHRLRNLSITDVVDHYDKDHSRTRPAAIIIGIHSAVLHAALLDRGPGAAAFVMGDGAHRKESLRLRSTRSGQRGRLGKPREESEKEAPLTAKAIPMVLQITRSRREESDAVLPAYSSRARRVRYSSGFRRT